MARIDREELRVLVRQALREAFGTGAGTAPKAPARAEPAPPRAMGLDAALRRAVADGGEVPVSVRSADDLGRFARAIAEATAEPSVKAAILSGKVRFIPADASPTAPAAAAPQPKAGGPAYEMAAGVLSETKLVELARSHMRIVLGAGVVLTPLARDKARALKIELTRQKP